MDHQFDESYPFVFIGHVWRNWGKQRTAFHAIKDFNSLSQAIGQSVNLKMFNRNLLKFVIQMNFMPSRILTSLARQLVNP